LSENLLQTCTSVLSVACREFSHDVDNNDVHFQNASASEPVFYQARIKQSYTKNKQKQIIKQKKHITTRKSLDMSKSPAGPTVWIVVIV